MAVTIYPDHSVPGEATRIAQILLDAADTPGEVQVDTQGNGMAFVIPESLAAKVDLDHPEAAPEQDSKSTKKRKDKN